MSDGCALIRGRELEDSHGNTSGDERQGDTYMMMMVIRNKVGNMDRSQRFLWC